MALHGEPGAYRADRDLDAVRTTIRHRSFNCHELIEAHSQIGPVRPLHGEVADQWWTVFDDLDIARHQEIHNDIDGISAIVCGDCAHELEASKNVSSLIVAMLHE